MSAAVPKYQRPDGSEYKPKWGIHYGWWLMGLFLLQYIIDGAYGSVNSIFYPTFLMPKAIGGWGWAAPMLKQPIGYAMLVHAAMAWVVGWTWDHWVRYGKWRFPGIIMFAYVLEIALPILFLSVWLRPDRNWVWWIYNFTMNCISPWVGVLPLLAITNWFQARRGLALGIVGSGAQGGTPLVWGWLAGRLAKPFIVSTKIGTKTYQTITRAGMNYLWRLSASIVVVVIPLYFFFVRTWPSDLNIRPYGAPPWSPAEKASKEKKEIPPEWNWGYTMGEAVKTRAFWLLFIGVLMSPFFWMILQSGATIQGGTVLGLPVATVGLGVSLYGWVLAIQGGLLGHVFDWRGWDKRFAIAWGPIMGITAPSLVFLLWKAAGGYLLGQALVACGIGAWFGMIAATYVSHFGPRAMGMVFNIGCRFNTYFALWGAYMYGGWCFEYVKKLTIPGIPAGTGGYWPGWHLPGYQGNVYWGLISAVFIIIAARPSLDMYARLKNPPPFARARRAELEKAGQLSTSVKQPWW